MSSSFLPCDSGISAENVWYVTITGEADEDVEKYLWIVMDIKPTSRDGSAMIKDHEID